MTDPGLQERVARLEGRTEDFGERFDGLDRRIDSLERRMDVRFEAVDRRFEALDRRLEGMDRRFDDPILNRLERRFDSTEDTATRYFHSVFGLEVATVVIVIGLWVVALLQG